MPNNSGNNTGRVAGGAYGWADLYQMYSSPTSSSASFQRVREEAQAETLVQSATDVAASDDNFALEATGSHTHTIVGDIETQAEPVVHMPPSDWREEHESDSGAIRQFRTLATSESISPDQRDEYGRICAELCNIRRHEWVANGGRMPPPGNPLRSNNEAPPTFASTWDPSRRNPGRRRSGTRQNFFGNIPESSTMTTVASTFGMRVNYPSIEKHPLIVGTHLAGVEIELENLAIEHPSFRYWTAKSDGSLRNNGMEFVCSHPWGGVDLYNAAVEIDGFLFNNNPDDTWRCSTHVHIDVRDMTAAQVKKMILAYVFYERVLFKCSGWHRYKNNFCVALGFAQGQLEDLGNWWAESDSRFLNNISSRWDKYTAINFLPMQSFGSIEFRISEAKWHKGQLIRLTNRFLSLKEVAVANSNLSDEQFLDMLMNSDPSDIIKKGIPKGLNNLQEDLEVGFKLAHDILSLAKLRRRSRRPFIPNLTDGSRIISTPRGEVFTNGWSHCVSHLTQRYPALEFPELAAMRSENGENYVFCFSWLYELYTMMRNNRLTFEIQWFLPQQNRSQLIRLWEQYLRQRREGEPEEEQQPVPVAGTQEWYEEDDSHEDDEDVEEPEW